jgi:hypothetical protein
MLTDIRRCYAHPGYQSGDRVAVLLVVLLLIVKILLIIIVFSTIKILQSAFK